MPSVSIWRTVVTRPGGWRPAPRGVTFTWEATNHCRAKLPYESTTAVIA